MKLESFFSIAGPRELRAYTERCSEWSLQPFRRLFQSHRWLTLHSRRRLRKWIHAWKRIDYLVRSFDRSVLLATQQRIHDRVPIETAPDYQARISGTPRYVKVPLIRLCQLTHDLAVLKTHKKSIFTNFLPVTS